MSKRLDLTFEPANRPVLAEVEFKGPAYIRPCGRGITLLFEHGKVDLMDMFNGNTYYEIEIKAKRTDLEGVVGL